MSEYEDMKKVTYMVTITQLDEKELKLFVYVRDTAHLTALFELLTDNYCIYDASVKAREE